MSKYYNYTNREEEKPKKRKVREFPQGGLGTGYAEQAAEAIRKRKKKQQKQIDEIMKGM